MRTLSRVQRLSVVLFSSGLAFSLTGYADQAAPLGSVPVPKPDTPWKTTIQERQDFKREISYVRGRRERLGLPASKAGIALAFSGGGHRAGTVALGALQGLEQEGLLKQVDYLSSVSGGSYTAAWYVSHILPPKGLPVSSKAGQFQGSSVAYQANRRSLLQVDKYGPAPSAEKGPINELESGRGFVFGKGNWRALGLLEAQWAATLPFNALFDVALHIKPVRGKFNKYHLNSFYEEAIRRTYLRPPEKLIAGQEDRIDGFFDGKPHAVTLPEINGSDSIAPYLIINAAMANRSPIKLINNKRPVATAVLPFEFSRFSCGAPFLGFIAAEHFGFPVVGAKDCFDLASGKAKREVYLRSNSIGGIPSTTKPIALSAAVAASGAALDASMGGTVGEDPISKVRDPDGISVPLIRTKRLWWDAFLKPLNLNLRYQNRNFSMSPESGAADGFWSFSQTAKDRLVEITRDRFLPTTSSNGLYLSDGAHVDNLGIYALSIRSDVKEIWAFDATADSGYKFSDLKRAMLILKKTGWNDPIWRNGRDPRNHSVRMGGEAPAIWSDDESPIFQATLSKGQRKVELFYVKLSYRKSDGTGTPFTSEHSAPLYLDNGRPTDLGGWLRRFKCGLPGYRGNATFPHTNTANLSFNRDDFVAYRELGRILATRLAHHKLRSR